MKHTANIITLCRIIMSVLLLFTAPFTIAFYWLYGLCGFSDILDGYVARHFQIDSDTGAKLDSIADFVMILIVMIKILPVIPWSTFMFESIAVIFLIRIISLIIGYNRYHKLAFLHTTANKIAGVALFLMPFFLPWSSHIILYLILFICLLSALEECCINSHARQFKRNIKGFWDHER